MSLKSYITQRKERILQLSARASSLTSVVGGILTISGISVPMAVPLALNIFIFAVLFAVEFAPETIGEFKERFEKKHAGSIVSDNDIIALYELRTRINEVISASEVGSQGIPF